MASSGSFDTNDYDGRYLTFSWSVKNQSIENNTTTISWTLKGAGNAGSSWYNAGNFKVVINGVTIYSSSTIIKLYNETIVSSGDFIIDHNSDGTKSFTASAQAGIYTVEVNCTGSGSWSLPPIARAASLTAAPDFTDEQDPTIAYNNSAGNSVSSLQACISFNGSSDDIYYRDIPKTENSYTFELTDSERNILRAATPNSNTLSVIFKIKTVIGGATYYSSLARTMTIVNAAPTISGVSYEDTNATTAAITGDDQKIIQNNSTVSFTLADIAALKGATLTNVDITINSINVSTSLSGSSITETVVSYGIINSSSNLTAEVTLTDSRGNTTTVNKQITILAWTLPSAIITCARRNNYYSETDLKVNASYASLGGENAITIQYQTREQGASSWSSWSALQDDVQTTITLDNTKAWDIRVKVTDRLGSTTYNLSVDKGLPIIYFDRVLRSVGINCFPADSESLEVDGINILKELFYYPGDEYTNNGRIVDNGYITTNSTSISFTVTLPKSTRFVTPTIRELKVNARHVGGGFIFNNGSYVSSGYDVLSDPDITVSLIKDEKYLTITLTNTTAWSVKNDTPVSMALESFAILFNITDPQDLITENGENIITENGENIITEV